MVGQRWTVWGVGALLVLGLVGCSSSRSVVPGDAGAPGGATWAEINAALAAERVTVQLADGREVAAIGVRGAPDSTSWFDLATGAYRTVPTETVRALHRVDRRRGAVRGAKIGAMAGGVVGAVVGGYVFHTPVFADTPGEAVGGRLLFGSAAFGLLGMLPGSLHGGLVGYAVGTRDAVELPPASPAGAR